MTNSTWESLLKNKRKTNFITKDNNNMLLTKYEPASLILSQMAIARMMDIQYYSIIIIIITVN